MEWRNTLATFLIALALAGCAQGVADNRSYAPYSPENNGNMHDSGGGGGGGGDGGSM
jgi:Spy/CpxP family protein refolding chaperone